MRLHADAEMLYHILIPANITHHSVLGGVLVCLGPSVADILGGLGPSVADIHPLQEKPEDQCWGLPVTSPPQPPDEFTVPPPLLQPRLEPRINFS